MLAELKFNKDQFAQFLEGERDNDLHRKLSSAIRAGIEGCLRDTLPTDWLKSVRSGREEFCIWDGRLGSKHFYLANLLQKNGFYSSDFRLQVDVQKNSTTAIESICPGLGADYTNEMSRFDGRELPPKVTFRDMSRWDRHAVQFYSIHIDSSLLPFSLVECGRCKCPITLLRPVRISPGLFLDWICICCGKQYLCNCSKGTVESLLKRKDYDNQHYAELFESSQYREGICHLCRGLPSEIQYGSRNNGGPIYQYYAPYIFQEAQLKQVDLREAENIVRDRLGVPRIGEGWVNEMLVVKTIQYLFPELTVEHQASPPWLGRQRFDAYIKEHRVAIEYNGEQHYRPIGVFGDEHGFRATKERDKRKLELSSKHGVEVVIFNYEDQLSDELIYQRVKAAIDRQINRIAG